MPTQDEFEAKLDELTDCVEKIGDEVADDIEGETDEGQAVNGYACEHGTHTYLLMGTAEWEHFSLRYNLNADQAIAQKYIVNDISDINQRVMRQARDRLKRELNGKPPEEKKELRINLMQMMSREGCILEFDTTGSLNIHGFNLDKRIYPYNDEFSIGDFHEAVQTVINLGWLGKDYLLDNYGLLETSI